MQLPECAAAPGYLLSILKSGDCKLDAKVVLVYIKQITHIQPNPLLPSTST